MDSSLPDQHDELRSSARRRLLLRGGFAAAPAALTLVSGSAFAATSSRCQRNAINGAPVTPPPAASDDVWIRVRAYVLTKTQGQTGQSIWISGNELTDIAAIFGVSSNIGASQWLLVGVSGDSAYKAQSPGYILSSAPSEGNGSNTQTASNASTQYKTGNYYAVRFSSTGAVLGVFGDGSTTGTAISDSCLNSFRGI